MRNRKGGFGQNSREESGQACPVEFTLDVIGGKWKGVILFHLVEYARALPNAC